jgi:hypothetical protein
MTLLCCVKPVEFAEQVAGEVALEAAGGFAAGAAVGLAAGEVVAGGLVVAGAGGDDGVQGAVELAVSLAAEAVPDGAAGGGRERGGAGEFGEGGFGVDPAFAGPGQQELGGGQVPQAGFGGDQAGARSSVMAAIWVSICLASAARARMRVPSWARVWCWMVVSRSAPSGAVRAAQARGRRAAGSARRRARRSSLAVVIMAASRARADRADCTAWSRLASSSRINLR